MSPKRKRLIMIASLVLLCIFGCIGLAEIAQKGSEGQAPIRVLKISIGVDRREELFAQLRKFADKHGFEIYIRDVEVIPEGIFIEMYRADLEILAGSAASDPATIELGIYERDPKNPTPDETVDELVNDLKNFISEIPDVTITEEE